MIELCNNEYNNEFKVRFGFRCASGSVYDTARVFYIKSFRKRFNRIFVQNVVFVQICLAKSTEPMD